METSAETLYKLMILFCLDSVNVSLTNAMISDYMLSREYTNYFNIQTVLNELVDEELITSTSTYKTTYYNITEDGRKALDCFHYELPAQIKNDIKNYFKENIGDIVETLSIFSDYTLERANEYTVTCSIQERDTLLASISLTVPDEKTAQAVCGNWKKKSSDIYSYLVTTLLN